MTLKTWAFYSIAVLLLLVQASDKLEITLKNNSQSEMATKEELQRLLKQYDTSKWTFTRKVVIEDNVIPHSHPVLTVSTREVGEDLLSAYVHEQIHWFLSDNRDHTFKTIEEFKGIYQKVPVGGPDGARNEFSTYLHLIVNYLEYEAMKELIGEAKARELLAAKRYYRWIYKTVLDDGPRIREIVERNQLQIRSSTQIQS